jgi:hypothetical protein
MKNEKHSAADRPSSSAWVQFFSLCLGWWEIVQERRTQQEAQQSCNESAPKEQQIDTVEPPDELAA